MRPVCAADKGRCGPSICLPHPLPQQAQHLLRRHLAHKRQEGFEHVQVVAVDDEVVIQPSVARRLRYIGHQGALRDYEMVVVAEFLNLETQLTLAISLR